jgi:hypothetical protein
MTTALQSPSLINDFADFLATGPARREIVDWRPSEPVVERANELAEKRKEGEITADEEKELEAFLNSEIMLSLLKARSRRLVFAGAGGKCEYCLRHDSDSALPHQPDHITSRRPAAKRRLRIWRWPATRATC